MKDTDPTGSIVSTPKGGLFGGPFNSSGLDPNVRAVMMDYRWTSSFGGSIAATQIPYSFPGSAADFLVVAGYPEAGLISTFKPATPAQQAATRTAFGLVASYTNLAFVEVSSGLASASTFRFASTNPADGSSRAAFPANNGVYSPSDSRVAGDVWLSDANGSPPASYFGTDGFNTILHEMGHAFGLKHGHDDSYNGALAPDVNDNEFSVMTYASYMGADVSGATEARLGSSPQSYMMYDIAALQAYYGANFSAAGTIATYTWDAATGQENINGAVAPNTGTTATNKIFSTVWTQGATTTYDLSNFQGDQVDDMRPGQWLNFSKKQIADLNSDAAAGTAKYNNLAQGNIYNALLYNGDTRSEISDLVTGSGDDKITGNELDNVISGNAGEDSLDGGAGTNALYGLGGDDTFAGGTATADPDQLWGGNGSNTVDYSALSAAVYVDLAVGAGYVMHDTGPGLVLTDQMNSVVNAIGGKGNDTLLGDATANRLTGGGGGDSLHGNGGTDTFVYASAADSNLAAGYDTIADFIAGTDKIDLSAFNTDATHLVIATVGTSNTIYVEQTVGVYNPDTDIAISANTTGAGGMHAAVFVF